MHKLLEKMIEKKRVPHAMVWVGGAQVLKSEAFEFAAAVAERVDVHESVPEGKVGLHAIKKVRQMLSEVGLAPFGKGMKVFVFHEAERMLPTSSNALLKVLEEPPERTVFLLLTEHPERMLQTIDSRCQKVHFPESPPAPLTPLQTDFLALLAGEGSLEALAKKIEERKKHLLTTLEGEEGESEGIATLHYQQDVSSLFSVYYQFHCDLYAQHLGLSPPHFPEQTRAKSYHSLALAEKTLKEVQLALERGISLKTLLEQLIP